ncbi:MAG TPA: hypothetical protein VMU04_14690, partial [Candidatus Acidoferrum sp.]|nr:hypothetical protein [Candidatus Acidoferrum sp.]
MLAGSQSASWRGVVTAFLLTLQSLGGVALAQVPSQVGAAVPPGAPPVTPIPQTTAGWVKYDANPVIGGKYGTCFDVAALKDGPGYRMWLSWRPKQSLALVESKDGIHWSEPPR